MKSISCYSLIKFGINSHSSKLRCVFTAAVMCSDKSELCSFKFETDRFNGVTVHSDKEQLQDESTFTTSLNQSLSKWNDEGKRTIWFHVSLKYSKWLPILSEHDFRFHRVSNDGQTVVMYKWLPKDRPSHIPPYAHTMVGVGSIVLNAENALLVVLERYGSREVLKLPGGYVEPGENLSDAAIREVKEETGVETCFKSCILFRHTHFANFDCSDLYFIVNLEPLTTYISEETDEVVNARWMPVDEFLNHSKVHELNRMFVRTFQRYQKNRIQFTKQDGLHPVTQKPYTVYFVENDSMGE